MVILGFNLVTARVFELSLAESHPQRMIDTGRLPVHADSNVCFGI